MVILDFDDTLFDTHEFKRARMRSLAPLGVSEAVWKETYKEARNTPDGLFTYSNKRHAEVLAERGFDEGKVFAILEETVTRPRLQSFLLPGAVSLVESIRARGKTLVLLSLGDPLFQELKVKGCGVAKRFNRLFMVKETKEHILRELFLHTPESSAWFVNDKVRETLELHALFPAMRIILKQSSNIPAEEYTESGLPFFSELTDIERYVAAHAG